MFFSLGGYQGTKGAQEQMREACSPLSCEVLTFILFPTLTVMPVVTHP